MKVLVACEESQRVCKAFREKGHGILQRQQNGEYEPKIQAKDEPHAKGYIDMIEPLTIPANIF